MHFKMSSAICFNLDQSKSLSSGKDLKTDLITESGMEQDAVYTLQLTYNTFDTCANEDILGFERDLSVILQQEVISYPVCTMGYNCIVGMVTSNCTDDVVAVEFSIIVTCDNGM